MSGAFKSLQTLVAGWRPQAGVPLEPLELILLAWPGIVGARVAQHSQPLELQDGQLLVATRSSAWSQQLQFLEPEILERLRAGGGPAIARLRFRSGRLRAANPSPRVAAASKARAVVAPEPQAEPAPDVESAFARARERIEAATRSGPRCVDCGAPAAAPRCAPCRGERGRRRRVDVERLYFNVPWLDTESIVSLVPGLEPGELEAVRRGLLQRWWLSLERLRRSSRAATVLERQIASSYVLLQSGLAPSDVTPAVMRNVLGADLEARLLGSPGSPGVGGEDNRP